jgi:hypothetical protein
MIKRTVLYETVEINIETKKIYYRTKEQYNTPFNVKFEDLTDPNLILPHHHLIFRELLKMNHPEEFL